MQLFLAANKYMHTCFCMYVWVCKCKWEELLPVSYKNKDSIFSVLQESPERRKKEKKVFSSKSAYWKLPLSQRTPTFGLRFLAQDMREDGWFDRCQMMLACSHIFSKNHLMANLTTIFWGENKKKLPETCKEKNQSNYFPAHKNFLLKKMAIGKLKLNEL